VAYSQRSITQVTIAYSSPFGYWAIPADMIDPTEIPENTSQSTSEAGKLLTKP